MLRFDQNLDPSRTSIEVRDASGARVVRGGEIGDGPRILRLELPELVPGLYEVRWISYSAEDNELARDTYTFEVLMAPATSPTTVPSTARPSASAAPTVLITLPPSPPTASAPPDAGGEPEAVDATALIPVVVALLVVGGLGLWLRRRRP